MNPTTVQPQLGLAIAALILGVLSFLMSFLLIGALLGLVGLVVALVHLQRPFQPRGLAIAGLSLSVLGILASIGFGVLYVSTFRSVVDSMGTGSALRVWEGVEAPDFTVTTLDGDVLTLSDLEGKRVLVDFWATWCGPCIQEVPHFNRLREETSTDELIMVGISKEAPSVIAPFLEEHGITYPTVSTSDLPAPYSDVSAIPTTFFIDRNGVIQNVVTGYRSFDVLKEHALAGDYQGEVLRQPEESEDSDSEIASVDPR